uniref:Uncharacterized protein n=1 Tax=Araucaria cunninghamii TaxID=56994 RepID=A0A0D6QT26_ARACU
MDLSDHANQEIESDSNKTAGLKNCDDLCDIDIGAEGDNKQNQHSSDGYGAVLEEGVAVPGWTHQLTFRGFLVSAMIGTVFAVTIHKLMFTIGVIPILNIAAGLLGYFLIKLWTSFTSKLGFWNKPFTRQENTVIQTCVVSCASITFNGGYGLYLTGMDENTYEVIGRNYPGNRPQDVKNPSLGWIFAFLFAISFQGIFVLVPLRKIMIIVCKLMYPSGTATATLINSFHTPKGSIQARKQINCLLKCFSISFLWSMFKWFFSGGGEAICGFENFPSLGMTAFENKFYFDFSLPYIGTGMICPLIVDCSVMFGAIISWGVMWPLIRKRAGDWYPVDVGTSNFKGLFGYQVFFSVAMILGDGLYNFVKIWILTIKSIYNIRKKKIGANKGIAVDDEDLSAEEKKRNHVFLKDRIPLWMAASGYVCSSVIAMIVVPIIFPSLSWYHIMACFVGAPVLAFCNAYGAGLTDWNWATAYGNLGLFVFAAWVGKEQGGVIAGLAACGVMLNIVGSASDLMQDFRTGYLTLSSPRSMFVAQLAGAAMGCIIGPLTFWLFWNAYKIGDPNGPYRAPFAVIYREMAITGVEGVSSLPKYCVTFSCALFAISILMSFARDILPKRIAKWLPIPMAMAIPFYIGAYLAIDMFIGGLIVYAWERLNPKKAKIFIPAVASGFICGDGVWIIPASILALAKVNPPICMMFVSSKQASSLRG